MKNERTDKASFNLRSVSWYILSLFSSSDKKANTTNKNTNNTFIPNAGLIMGLTVVVSANLEDYYYPLISGEGLSVSKEQYREFHQNSLLKLTVKPKKI